MKIPVLLIPVSFRLCLLIASKIYAYLNAVNIFDIHCLFIGLFFFVFVFHHTFIIVLKTAFVQRNKLPLTQLVPWVWSQLDIFMWVAVYHLVTAVLCPSQSASPVTFHRPWIFGDAGELQVSMATRLLHHYSPAAVVKLVFGQALRQPNSDSTHSSHTAVHAKTLSLNSSN